MADQIEMSGAALVPICVKVHDTSLRRRCNPIGNCQNSSLSPMGRSGRRMATSAEESHPLNFLAPLATILNDVFTPGVGGPFLKQHCLFTYDAV
jgi:hypothetical protein